MEEQKEPKKRRGRFSYINEYKKDAEGRFVFCGRYYGYANADIPRRTLLIRIWVCLAAGAAASVAGGCFPAAGSVDSVFVIVPYIAEICSLALCFWAVLKYSRGGDPIKDHIYASAKKLPVYGIVYAASAAAGLLSDAIYLTVKGAGGMIYGTAAYLLLKAAAAVAGYFTVKLSRGLRFEERDNQG